MTWLFSPCALLRRLTLGADAALVTRNVRRDVRAAVHHTRNIAQMAVASSRRSERASEETTRVAEDAIQRIERARADFAHD